MIDRSERGLGCRGTVRRSVRGRWEVAWFYKATRNHERSCTKWRLQYVKERMESEHDALRK